MSIGKPFGQVSKRIICNLVKKVCTRDQECNKCMIPHLQFSSLKDINHCPRKGKPCNMCEQCNGRFNKI